ncbi:hypothetical protein K1X84_03655 [bacterium]|nr:hypothetical protein [bacterium]
MNTSGKNILIITLIASVGVIFITLLSDQSNSKDAAFIYSSYNTKSNGTHALFTLLGESGFSPARLRKDFRAKELSGQHNIIICIAPIDTIGIVEMDSLSSRVSNGSTAIFFYSRSIAKLLRSLGIQYGDFYGSDRLTLQQPAAHNIFIDSLKVPSADSSEIILARFYSDSASYTVLYANDSSDGIIEVPHGEGSFIFFHSPDYVSNAHLAEGRQADALIRMITFTTSGDYRLFDRVYFDEYHQGFREYQSLIQWFDEWPVKLGILMASLAVIVWAYSGAKRFGRPVPVRVQPVRSSKAHVESVMRVYQRARANRLILKIWRQWLMQFLYDRYKTGSETKLAQMLANRYNLNNEAILKLFRETDQKIRDAEISATKEPVQKRKVSIDDGDLIRLCRHIDTIYFLHQQRIHVTSEKSRNGKPQ